MSDAARGLILWIVAAVGVLYLYCGLKNVTPRSLLASFVNPSTPTQPVEVPAGTEAAAAKSIGAQALNAHGTVASVTGDTTPLGSLMAV